MRHPPFHGDIAFVSLCIEGNEHTLLTCEQRYPVGGMAPLCCSSGNGSSKITTLLSKRKRIELPLCYHNRCLFRHEGIGQIEAIGAASNLLVSPAPLGNTFITHTDAPHLSPNHPGDDNALRQLQHSPPFFGRSRGFTGMIS